MSSGELFWVSWRQIIYGKNWSESMYVLHKHLRCFKICLFAASLSLWPLAGALGDDESSYPVTHENKKEPLQGEVEEEGIAPSKKGPVAPKEPLAMPVLPPVVPKVAPKAQDGQGKAEQASADQDSDDDDMPKQPLRARVERSQLKGEEEMDSQNPDNLGQRRANAAPDDGRLKGSAHDQDEDLAREDPDAQDQDLQVEWDRWRNRFLRAVLANAMDNINNPEATDFRWDPVRRRVMSQYPLGTISWFSCQITNHKHITNLKLDQTSGYPAYDRAVLDAVQSLDGTSLLRFPSRSRRTIVSQNGGVKTSDTAKQQYFNFGDVEHVHIPAN
jgi:hypothetical protein